MKKLLVVVPSFVAILFTIVLLTVRHTNAAFNANNLIGDAVFSNSGAMSASDIDAFLNSKPNSCISTNSGFQAKVPSGYSPSTGFTYGNFGSAGQVIATGAQVYGISPKVLLVTLQKEQSLVAGGVNFCNNGDENKYAAAAGYGCPDSGSTYNWSGVSLYKRNGVEHTVTGPTCVNTALKAGFSQQVIRAAWLLKFGQQRSLGNTNWAVVTGNWDNSDDPQTCYGGPMTQGTWHRCPNDTATFYDGYITIDGSATHMDTGGTAALYWYTPHFHGNQIFVSIFDDWFGSTQTNIPYAWAPAAFAGFIDSGRTRPFNRGDGRISIAPGSKAYIRIRAYNNGYQTWTKSRVHLGTSHPQDRCSQFADSSWLAAADCQRIEMTNTSVAPGNIATYDFSLTSPANTGTYRECFNLVAEGITWLNDPNLCFLIDVVNPLGAVSTTKSLTAGQSLAINQSLVSEDAHTSFSLRHDGNLVLLNSFKPMWSTGLLSGAARLVMQNDGNLVLYNSANKPLWDSETNNHPGAFFTLQTDGNAVIYDTSSNPLWATYTNGNPSGLSYIDHSISSSYLYPMQSLRSTNGYHLILQSDGNLVLYSKNRALWSAQTNGKPSAFVAMQGDGNLVIYDKGLHPLWSSGTAGQGKSTMYMQEDGNLVIYNSKGKAIWNTATNGQS
jgi:hypothetical protein